MNLTECKSNLIPIPDQEIQQKYKELFLKYTSLFEKSKTLISEAKQDVEALIEGSFDESKIMEAE